MSVNQGDMTNREAMDMMSRCKNDILGLRGLVKELAPKAEAYDAIIKILGFIPGRSQGAGEDIVWIIDRRMETLHIAEKEKRDQSSPG